MEWVASTLHTTSEHGVSSITTADAHTSAASSRLNWRPRRFEQTRPFRRKTKCGFCACVITFQTQSTGSLPGVKRPGRDIDHPPPSSLEVNERVELYIFSSSGPSWLVLGWTLLVLKSSGIRLRLLPRRSGKGSRKRVRPTKYFDLCLFKITDMNLVQKRNPFYLVRPSCSFCWMKRVTWRTVSLLLV